MILLGMQDRFNERLASDLGIGLHPIDYREFPDSEVYLRFEEDTSELKGTDVLLSVRGSAPSFKTMNMYLFAIFAGDKLTNEYGSRVFCLMPYMPFQRQDKRWRRGEVTSLMTARKELKRYMECLVNVSLHDYRREGWRSDKDDFNGAPEEEHERIAREKFGMSLGEFHAVRDGIFSHIYSIDPSKTIGQYLAENGYGSHSGKRDPVTALSPDLTSSEFVDNIADIIGARTYSVPKDRDKVTGAIRRDGRRMPPLDLIRGMEVMLIDDMITTGGTMADLAVYSKQNGARRVICVATHAVLAEKGGTPCLKRLYDAGVDDVITTDTIISLPVSRIEIARTVAKRLKEKVFPKYVDLSA